MTIAAAAELCLVLRELSHNAELIRRPPAVRTGGIPLQVIDTDQSTHNAVAKVVARAPSAVLVSSTLRIPHQQALAGAGAGGLDRSGQRCVHAIGIEQAFRPLAAAVPPVADPWQRPSVVGVALTLIQLGGPVPTAYDLAFHAGLTHASAGRALRDLRALGMIDEHDRPRTERLRTQLAARWCTRWFALASVPPSADTCDATRLVLGLHDDLRCPGWADLAPDLEATGAAGSGGELPRPRLLVPDRRALAWAIRTLGRDEHTHAATFLPAAPRRVATAQRRPPTAEQRWPRPHPIVLERETLATGTLDANETWPGQPSRHDLCPSPDPSDGIGR